MTDMNDTTKKAMTPLDHVSKELRETVRKRIEQAVMEHCNGADLYLCTHLAVNSILLTLEADWVFDLAAQRDGEPYLYVYEYDSHNGVHREFSPREWNGMKPGRTVQLYTHPRAVSDEMAIEVLSRFHGVRLHTWSQHEVDGMRAALTAALSEKGHG
jgi:hypothetical protein